MSWTRLLTLTLGHTTAAASTVVAAFLGGLAIGAFAGGRVAKKLSQRAAIYMYAALEVSIVGLALLVPYELGALTPLLAWSYRQYDSAPMLFPLVRVLCALMVVFIPALALGATFPAAIRAFVRASWQAGSSVGALYAANTTGAAIGAVLAGFVLIPALGIFGTTLIGMGAGLLSAATAVVLARRGHGPAPLGAILAEERQSISSPKKARGRSQAPKAPVAALPATWLAAVALVLSGFASLLCEIVWTRTFAMVVGPTTYAFAATVAAMITGIAIGGALGAWIAQWTIRPALWLAITVAATAAAIAVAGSFAGTALPRLVAEQLASASQPPTALLIRQSFVVAALILPAAIGFGVAFPLALALLKAADTVADRVGTVYALNTIAAVAGSLAAGFLAIPVLGLQRSLWLAVAVLVLDAAVISLRGGLTSRGRLVGIAAAAIAAGVAIATPAWDRDLLSSGGYKYAPRIAKTVDLETALKAGTLLFYEEGAASTVSVKRLTGTISLSIDGKVDASSVGDMLTQKALAHLPLLLHDDPREICIVGLGSGVTLASALTHGVERADVVEISTGVVRASQFFEKENHRALADARTHLIVGDGRSHLALTDRQYDVIISEPSNPWVAGVAALFTREFFSAVRNRLAANGIICQWAHTYDISADDFRSIVATFVSVFPEATIWRIGEGDVLLVGSSAPIQDRLSNIERSWARPGVAADLAQVSAHDPFAFLSLYAGGPQELAAFSRGAAIQRDNRMALEFSGPRAMLARDSASPDALSALEEGQRPEVIARAFARATGADWRNRASMLAATGGYLTAYDDFSKAVRLDPEDAVALDGLVRAAVAIRRESETLTTLSAAIAQHPNVLPPYLAASKLAASSGSFERAVDFAERARGIEPVRPEPIEQLASLYADIGDAASLAAVLDQLRRVRPNGARTLYFEAALRFLRGQLPEAAESAGRAIAADPGSAASYNLLGAIAASRGDGAGARQAFTTALSLNPRDAATYTNLGLLDLNSSQPDAAMNLFAEALSLDPQSQQALSGLAEARSQSRR